MFVLSGSSPLLNNASATFLASVVSSTIDGTNAQFCTGGTVSLVAAVDYWSCCGLLNVEILEL